VTSRQCAVRRRASRTSPSGKSSKASVSRCPPARRWRLSGRPRRQIDHLAPCCSALCVSGAGSEIDGQDIRNVTKSSLRGIDRHGAAGTTGLVQRPIPHNIRYGRLGRGQTPRLDRGAALRPNRGFINRMCRRVTQPRLAKTRLLKYPAARSSASRSRAQYQRRRPIRAGRGRHRPSTAIPSMKIPAGPGARCANRTRW